jgi:hypothetical protein
LSAFGISDSWLTAFEQSGFHFAVNS